MEKDYITPVLTRFVAELAIPVTRQSVRDELQRHTDAGSLFAFSDALNKWRVPNEAFKIDFEHLGNLPLPFIAHINNKEFAVVTKLDGQQAALSNSRYKNKVYTIDEFKQRYSGSALVAEKEDGSGEADYAQKRRKEIADSLRTPVFIAGSAIILIGFLLLHSNYLNTFNLQTALLTIFITAGLLVSVLLLVQSIDANNPLVQKLCGDDNKNCNAILSSKAAKVTRWLSWSEAGFFYFAGTWPVFMFNTGHTALMQTLAVLSVPALFYTFYSVYYQWRIAKQWCVLCCTVQAVLWLQFFAFLPSLSQWVSGPRQLPNSAEVTILILCMAVPVVAWIKLKPLLLKAEKSEPLQQQLDKFKNNPGLFNRLLNEETQFALLADKDTLILGNPEAENTITVVANPYCQPCAKAHKALQWMEGREDVKLQIIFSTSGSDNGPKAIVAAHLLAMQNQYNNAIIGKALHDWYEQKQKNVDAWIKDYPAEKSGGEIEQLEKQREWCKLTEIKGTPTIFINGRRLPKYYKPEDLKYFI